MANTGTYDVNDLLNYDNTTAEAFGYDQLNEVITRELEAVNAVVSEATSLFATETTEREEGAPTGGAPRMVRVNPDYGRSRGQKGAAAAKRGFPLESLEYAVGWTALYLKRATPADIAKTTLDARIAYEGAMRDGLMRAFFRPTNYVFYDYVTPDKLPVDVKALANGDGEVPPTSATGKKFTGAHNHFFATSGLTAAGVNAAVTTVSEHYEGNQIIIYISADDEPSWRNLAGFNPYLPSNIQPALGSTVGVGALDTTITDNRPIGVWQSGAVVHTKSWVPTGYAIPINLNAPKPLKKRVDKLASLRGLFLAGDNVAAPLQATAFQAFFGFGASERYAASVLYTGGASYVSPLTTMYADEEGSA